MRQALRVLLHDQRLSAELKQTCVPEPLRGARMANPEGGWAPAIASSRDAELLQQRRLSVLRENLNQCRSENRAELLTSKRAQFTLSLYLRLIMQNRVQ